MPLTGERKRQHNKRMWKVKSARTANRGDKKILVSFRAYESLVGRIQRLLLEGLAGKIAFPWKDKNSAFNGLLIDGLESRLLKLQDQHLIDEILPYLDTQAQINGMRTQRQEAFSLLAMTKDEVSELLGIGAEREAGQVYHTTVDAVVKMPKTVWNDHLLTELRKSFPQLAQAQAKGVRLVASKRRATR